MPYTDLSESYTVSPQISADDVADLSDAGYTTIICNRPDGEEPGQPSAADIAAACKQSGMAFYHLPFQGAGLTPDLVSQFRDVLDGADGRVLAYCRSGQRCAFIWENSMQPSS